MLWSLLLMSCGSTATATTATDVCDAYEKGVSMCNGRSFDTTECKQDLTCLFELYRQEATDFYARCADRFNQGECPALEDYQCADAEAMFTPSMLARDFAASFENKQSACASSALKRDIYDARTYVRDEVLTESQPCLALACTDVNGCLTAAVARVASSCTQ
jgi:hypothetical protein